MRIGKGFLFSDCYSKGVIYCYLNFRRDLKVGIGVGKFYGGENGRF